MKKIAQFTVLLSVLLGLANIYFVFYAVNHDPSRLATALVLYPLLLLPWILKKWFHFHLSAPLELIYLLFIFLAQFLGSVINLYKMIDWYDTFVHFLSGILTAFLGLFVLVKFKKYSHHSLFFNCLFILSFVFLVAGLWEFYEFTQDQLTGSNLQHAIETGVMDTMEDFLAAFGGAILFLISYLYMEKNRKKAVTKMIAIMEQ